MTDVPWYPFYGGDYARKTAHLSMMEHGAYRLLIDHYFATRSPLPNDNAKLFRICRARTPSERKSVLSVAAEFFVIDGLLLRHERCDREIDKILKKSESQSAKAKLRHSQSNATAEPRQEVGTDPEHERRGQHDFESKLALSESDKKLENNISASAVALPRTRVSQPQPEEGKKEEVRKEDNNTTITDFQRVHEAGSKLFPALFQKNSTAIHSWLNAGCSVERDILPELNASAGRNIASWNYFTNAVMNAKARREQPLPPGNARGPSHGSHRKHHDFATQDYRADTDGFVVK